MPDGSVCSSSLPYSRCYVTVQDTSVLQRLMKVFDKKVVSSPSRVYIDQRPNASIESDRDYLEFIENETVSSFVLSE